MKTQRIKAAIFPTVEDELNGITKYTCYIPIGTEFLSLIENNEEPFNLEITIKSHKELHDAEIQQIKGKIADHIAGYQGELELKKCFRLKALKYPSIIEMLLLLGMAAGSFYPFYGWFMSSVQLILSTILFWLLLIFIRSSIGPFLGGFRYRGLQEKVALWTKNLCTIQIKVVTDQTIKDVNVEFEIRDTMNIYHLMADMSKGHFPLAADFYEELPRHLTPKGSYVTRLIPARFRDDVKAIFDVPLKMSNLFIPIGEIEFEESN